MRVPQVFQLLIQKSNVLLYCRRGMAVDRLSLAQRLLLKLGTVCNGDNDKRFSIQVEGRQGEVGGWRYPGYEVVKDSSVREGQRRELVYR